MILARRLPLGSRRLRLSFATLVFFVGIVAACAPSIDEREAVHVLTYDGVVDPVMQRYIDRGIDEAERTDARAVVLRLDTPGGLVSTMEEIVQRINASEVPVIVWVYPSGGQAASAGTFITMAGHVAAMAPSTTIGAASPVGSGGEELDETLKDKATNDLVALITGLAEERGRNAEWAEDAVREAASANTSEAVELNVVDFRASTLDDLLRRAHGRTVRVGEAEREVTLQVRQAPVVENNPTLFEEFLAILSDPNIAFLLLSLGATGIFFELLNPGTLFPGIFGAISLILAFFSLGTLPTNWAGVALILLAFGLFAAEVFVSGFGILGIGGAVSLVLGGIILTSTSNPDFQVDWWLLYPMAAVLAAFFMMVVSALIRSRRAPVYIGSQAAIGKAAVARSSLDPTGVVFFEGARWTAEAEDGPIQEGERVTITGVQGLKLRVKKSEARPGEETGQER